MSAVPGVAPETSALLRDELSRFDPCAIPVRFSNLKHMGASPAHYLHAAEHGLPRTGALELGAAVDALVYGTQPVVAYPGAVRRGKEFGAFEAANQDAIILTKADMARADAMARAIAKNRRAVLLREGQRQRTIEWSIGGRACSGRPDTFTETHIADLKTCQSSAPEQFLWAARRYAYHAQLAWYRNGLLLSGVANPQEAYLIAIESRPPHAVTVFRLTTNTLEQGERTWRLWWERLLVCEASNEWPAYAQADVDLDTTNEEGESITLRIDGEETEI